MQLEQRKSLQTGFCVLSISGPSLFESLLSELTKYPRLILYLPWPGIGISHFSGKLWFPSKENGTRHQDLHSKCAHCFWGVYVSTPFQQTEVWGGIHKNTQYTYICTYTCITHMHAFTYSYLRNLEFIPVFQIATKFTPTESKLIHMCIQVLYVIHPMCIMCI